jgi:hypothetical protein
MELMSDEEGSQWRVAAAAAVKEEKTQIRIGNMRLNSTPLGICLSVHACCVGHSISVLPDNHHPEFGRTRGGIFNSR